MTTDRDTTRIVRSWLSSEEHESADHVLDNVLAELDATPQRRAWWPAWRIADVTTYSKLATAAAAVVVLAVAGILFGPRNGGSGGTGGPSPSPAPTIGPSSPPAPSSTTAPSSSAVADATFPPDGLLEIGQRYPMTREGVKLSFAVASSGWTSGQGFFVDRGTENAPDGAALIFWPGTPDNVYGDPCTKTPLSPPAVKTAAGLAAAVSRVKGTTLVSGPTDTTIGGFPATHVVIRIPPSIPCKPGEFQLWYDGDPVGNGRYAQGFDETLDVWIVDVRGTLVWIDGETYKGAAPDLAAGLQQIIDSITFP
jgi:hypothetical protein